MTSSVYQPQYMESDNYSVTATRSVTLGLIFNPDDTAFANAKIRKALSMGIDRANIGGNSSDDLLPAYGLIPPAIHWNGASYRDTYRSADCLRPDAALTLVPARECRSWAENPWIPQRSWSAPR